MDGAAKVERALKAWRMLGELDDDLPAAGAADLAEAERRLGRALPPELHVLYTAVDGGSFAGGNLFLHPLLPAPGDEEESVATASELMRSWDWPVPEPLVLVGSNGAGSQFGLWLSGAGGRPLAVELGEAFDTPALAVVGDDLGGFLLGFTAHYARLHEDEGERRRALDALGLPDELRSLEDADGDDAYFAALAWASPGLPDPRPDPYERALSAEKVAALAADR